MRRLPKPICTALCVLAAILLFTSPSWSRLLYLNTSPSIPIGVYMLEDRSVERGDYVAACMPDTTPFHALSLQRGYLHALDGACPNSQPLLKVAAALPGDFAAWSKRGVTINGSLWPSSAPLDFDSQARPLPHLSKAATITGLVLLSEKPNGWDSRYFGELPTAAVLGPLKPLWVVP